MKLIHRQKLAIVDIDTNLVIKQDLNGVRQEVLEHIDLVAKYTGTDIFLLNPKPQDSEGTAASYGSGSNVHFDQRLRIAIYGDPESSEHSKTRILIMIDQIVGNPQSDRILLCTNSLSAPAPCRYNEARNVSTYHHLRPYA